MQNRKSLPVLVEIEKRRAVLIPRWRVFLKRFSFWLLAALSVVTGGIAMATAFYVFFDNDFTVDHDTIQQLFIERPFIADIINSIPYVWLAALLLFTLVAFFGFRHTKKGYRYSAPKVIASSLLASLLFSLCLNATDVGGYIHRYLIENVRMYNSLIYANEQRWTNARKGLLGGKVIQIDKVAHIFVLKDFQQRLWSVDFSNAELRPKTRIAPGRFLKITGVTTGTGAFHAISIQNWEKRYNKRKEVQPKKVPLPVKQPAEVL
ncbi:MAG: hypothetical protein FDX02_03185 [Chlorobium sp.]|nr:MAG: hypothetical protein FDX02_03185 [Chlorobium sp.]